MKSDRLLVLTCVAGLIAGACADDPGSRGGVPTEPSFERKPPPPPPTACDLVDGAIGDVFAGNVKGDFAALLGLDDGISASEAFDGLSAISVAFNTSEVWGSRTTDTVNDPLSEYALNPAYQSWAGTLSKKGSPTTGAILARQIVECASDGGAWASVNTDNAFWESFEDDIEMALNQVGGPSFLEGYGSFAVRNPPSSDIVASPDIYLDDEPYWYVQGDWAAVFGEQVLIYGYGRDRSIGGTEQELGGSYEWKVWPPFTRFLNNNDVMVATCQGEEDSGAGQTGPRVLREGNVTRSASAECPPVPTPTGFSQASILSRFASAVGRLFSPTDLKAGAAVAVGGGFGGFASKWSPFDPSLIFDVESAFVEQPCKDQFELAPIGFGPNCTEDLQIVARTVADPAADPPITGGSPIEGVIYKVVAVDNNGFGKFLGIWDGDSCERQLSIEATTADDAAVEPGVALFPPLCVDGRGGYRLRVSSTNFEADFTEIDSDGFNARPNPNQ
jgi:hypothetical protein